MHGSKKTPISESLYITILFFLLLFYLSPFTTPYQCLSGRPLPLIRDCFTLLDALETVAHLPPFSTQRTWSRTLPDTPLTKSLPTTYNLLDGSTGRLLTCEIVIDIDASVSDERGTDEFSIRDLVGFGERVVENCLVRERMVGVEWPGRERRAIMRVRRVEGLLRVGRVKESVEVRRGNWTLVIEGVG